MSITTLSFTFVNTWAPQSTPAAAATERKASGCAEDQKSADETRHSGRRSRLVEAMMEALRQLGFTGTAAAAGNSTDTANTGAVQAATGSPAAVAASAATNTVSTTTSPSSSTTTTTPANAPASASAAAAAPTPATTTAPAPTLESAVQQFAHALFQALRQDGGSSGKASGDGERAHHHGHHGDQGRHQHGYDDLSQRLEALAQGVGASAAPAASAAATATTDASAAPTTATVTPTPATAAATPARSALLDAFSTLFSALKPLSTTTAATTETDLAAKLRSFLHTLAQAIAPDAARSVKSAQVGTLVDVTA